MKPLLAAVGAVVAGIGVVALVTVMEELLWLHLFFLAFAFSMVGLGGLLGWKWGAQVEARHLQRALDAIDSQSEPPAGSGTPDE